MILFFILVEIICFFIIFKIVSSSFKHLDDYIKDLECKLADIELKNNLLENSIVEILKN